MSVTSFSWNKATCNRERVRREKEKQAERAEEKRTHLKNEGFLEERIRLAAPRRRFGFSHFQAHAADQAQLHVRVRRLVQRQVPEVTPLHHLGCEPAGGAVVRQRQQQLWDAAVLHRRRRPGAIRACQAEQVTRRAT